MNFQKLLEEAPQTKSAMQALENEFGPRRRELMTMQTDLKAKEDKLQKEGAVMSEADRAQRREDAARPAARLLAQGRRVPGRRFDPQERGARQGAALPVQEIQTYAKAQGFDLVLGDGVLLREAAARHHRRGAGGAADASRRQLPASAPKSRRPGTGEAAGSPK